MREFNKVSPIIWRSRHFRSLPSLGAKLLLLYYHTNEHQRSSGCYRLPDGYAVTDLGWTNQEYHAVRREVIDAGAVVFDEATDELFILGWFESNPPMNDRHAVGCRREIARIESDGIREMAEEAFLKVDECRTADKGQERQRKVVDLPSGDRLTSTRYMQRGGR